MRFYLAILISLILHILLNLGLYWAPRTLAPSPREVFEVELAEKKNTSTKSSQKQRQIVRESLVPDHMKLKQQEDETLAKYLSANSQRVKQEMKAAQSGMTQNRAPSPSSQTQPSQPKTSRGEKLNQDLATDEDVIYKNRKKGEDSQETHRELPNFLENLPRGQSTVGESLPEEMQVGSFTALNTDRFTYYSFYARVEELIRFRWESRVKQSLEAFYRTNSIDKIRGRNWVSQFEFWLDPKGHLHSVHLMKESGVKVFDAAAEYAFRDAQVFPNPPKGLVDEDGFIRLKYSFNVFWNGPR